MIAQTLKEVEGLRVAGRLTAAVLDQVGTIIQPGITTDDINDWCHRMIVDTQQAIPAPLNYHGFPKSVCTSVNHVVCHGIPGAKKLVNGDIINVDVTVIKDGWYGDSSRMFVVGEGSVLAKRLIDVCRQALWLGIDIVKPGIRVGDIGHRIQRFVEANGFSVVREYCGHGLGRVFHEDPQILHYGSPGTGALIEKGMVFTIEPMINAGKRHVRLLPDQWTVVTKDHSLSAQWEHTLLVTDTGVEILTLGEHETAPLQAHPHRGGMSAEVSSSAQQTDVWDFLTIAQQRLAPLLTQSSPNANSVIACFKAVLLDGTTQLAERFKADQPIQALIHARAQLIDLILAQAWHLWVSDYKNELSLIAVGGYGRGELHPCSDIDIMVLLPKFEASPWQSSLEKFLTFLWDIGLEVGHSVRTIDDCQREALSDISVATTLMEARLIEGPAALFVAMRRALSPARIWSPKEFYDGKVAEQTQRHQRFFDTAYNLEPNIKASPGGLRDIQTIAWVAKRHFGADTLDDLVTHGFLTPSELRKLKNAQMFLWKIRFALHLITQRREDRLLFDHQIRIAQLFGYEDATYTLAVEQLMQRYYRTAMDISLLNEMLLQLFREAVLQPEELSTVVLNPRFQVCNDYLEVTADDVFEKNPSAMLELFQLLCVHQHLRGVRASTIRLLQSHLWLIDEEFRQNPRHHRLFLDILREPVGVTHAFRRMNLYGVLGRYIPNFGRIVGRMQYDLFHAYTVDAHTLFVLRNLRRLSLERFKHELPKLSEVFKALPRPELAYLAGLFHDIAKGRGGDHSELGAVDAEAFCLEQGLSRYDARLVAWLVRHHLDLSVTAQKKDISDVAVINDFARKVGDQTHLDYLYVLTVADVRGTNPKLWNAWKASLFDEFYERIKRALRQGLESPLGESELILETKAEVLGLLQRDGFSSKAIEPVWAPLSNAYFLRHTAEEIAWHTSFWVDRDPFDEDPIVAVRQETGRGGTAIFVYARRKLTSFARTTAVLDQMGLTVLDARITLTQNGFSVETYLVLEDSGGAILDRGRMHEIQQGLHKQLAGDDHTPTVTRRAPRQTRLFATPTQVSFSQDSNHTRTVLELVAADRPGLLSDVGKVFVQHQLQLHGAHIVTVGERAEDVFYLSDTHDKPLDRTRCDAIAVAVKATLDKAQG